jgi:PmbA protein
MEIGNYIIKKAQKLGADDVVATIISDVMRQTKFANNEIVVNQTWDSFDIDVFLSYKKRLVSSKFNYPSTIEALATSTSPKTFSKKSIDDFLTRLIKVAKLMKAKEDYQGLAEGPFKYKPLEKTYDKKIEGLSEKNIDFVESAINKALEEGAKRCAGVLYSNCFEIKKFSSNDITASDKGTSINLSIRAFADKDASGHSVCASRILKEFEPEKTGEEAGRLAKESTKPSEGEPEKYDVILSPMIVANLLNYMSYAFSSFEVESGMSFLTDKINQKVGSEIVTIIDDGRLENGFGSIKFDEEGRPTKTTKIIENGILKTYLHNTSTAKKFNVQSTANAGIVYPVPWNLILEKGNSTLEEMISRIKNGIYITNVWYTRFANYRTGDFSTIPRDAMFEIKDGNIFKPVKGLRLNGNMQKILESITAISKDRKMIQWWEVQIPVLTGYALVKDVQMTKSAK